MNIEKMREEFEAWSANHEYLGGVEIDRAISGNYSDVDLHHAWEAWQASREALVIALPKKYESDYGQGWYADADGELYQVADIHQAIEASGVKVKV